MAYAPDMGAAAPAPTWMGGHSSIEQPTNPFIMQLVQWLMAQQGHGQGHPFDKGAPGASYPGLVPLPNPRPGPPIGMPQHPGPLGRFPLEARRMGHVGDVHNIARQMATNMARFKAMPYNRMV